MIAHPQSTGAGRALLPPLLFLGVCPLLATGTTLLSAACLGATAALVLCASACCLLACRRLVPASAPLVFLLLLTAAWVSVIDLALQYWLFPLRQGLGVYVPLIAANCLVLSTLEEHILGEGSAAALRRACMVGVWLILCVAAVGGIRELAATGQLLGDLGLLGFEPPAAGSGPGLVLMRSPAGAFLALGLLAAVLQSLVPRRLAD